MKTYSKCGFVGVGGEFVKNGNRCKKCRAAYNKKHRNNNKKSISGGYIDGKIKTCTKCKEIRNISEFTKDKKYIDGLDSQCRDCKNESGKKYRENNPEKTKEKQIKSNKKTKEKYNTNENYRKKRLRKDKKYRDENPEKILKQNREYRKNNKEKVSNYQKEYSKKNRKKKILYSREYYQKHAEHIKNNRVVFDKKSYTIEKVSDPNFALFLTACIALKKYRTALKNLTKGEKIT